MLNSDIKIIRVPVLLSRIKLIASFSYYFFLPIISAKYFLKLKPAILYTRSSFLDCISVLPLKIFFNFSYVAELNGIRSFETKGSQIKKRIVKLLERLTLRLCNKVVSVTPEIGQWVVNNIPARNHEILISSNGVDTDIFKPLPVKSVKNILGLDSNRIHITFTSSLKPWHGTEILLNAIKYLVQQSNLDFKVLIVGDGPERKKCEILATKLAISDYVQWVGKVTFQQVPLYINAGDICVAPFSGKRNQAVGLSPLKVFEYMSCGKAFITTRVNAEYDNLIKSWDCGLLIEPDNPIKLADAILKLLTNDKLRKKMEINGRSVVLEKYSWKSISNNIFEFIRR